MNHSLYVLFTMIVFHFLLFFVLCIFSNHLFNKIRNLPPSPFPTLPMIGHLHLLKKPLHRSLASLSNRYGPVLLLQFGYRRVLIVSSPSAAEDCFTKNDVVFANRPRLLFGKHLGYNYTNIASAPYGDHWRNLRKVTTSEILSSHRLQLLSSIRIDEVKLMIQRLHRNKDETVDLKSVFFELMLNVMMRMIAGKRYYGENVEEIEEAKRFKEIVRETFLVAGANNIGDYLPLVAVVGGEEKKLRDLATRRDGFIQNLINERRSKMASSCSNEDKKKTLIEVLLTLQESEPENYTDEIIKSHTLGLLAAGTDTSANTMEWIMSLLVNYPECLKKAQTEIDGVVGHGRLMDESDISKLPYLHCIINEAMRMFPPGPLLVPHESLQKCFIGGYCVPANTMLLVNVWSIQNDPQVWKEPTKFKPERFEGCEGVRDFRFMPFGSGRRSCPGEGLAMRMIALGLGSILQCLDLERVGEETVDMTEGIGLTMPKAQALVVKCSTRPSMVNLLFQLFN